MLPAISDYFGGPHNLIRGSALFVVVLLFYWYDIRPYALLSITFLLYVLTERVRNESIVFNCPAISEKSLQEIKKFRSNHPGKFCAFISASFVLLGVLGNIISGPLFCALIVICLIGKKYIPENVKEVCNQSTWSLNANEVEDFLPELNEKNIELLNYAKDAKSKNDSDAESDKTEAFLLDKTPNLSDSSSESADEALMPSDGIEFLSGHFNGDSNVDEEYFEKGLHFKKNVTFEDDTLNKQKSVSESQSNIISDLMTNVTSMPWNIVSNIISNSSSSSTNNLNKESICKQESESDSEFEILESDELNIT